MPEGEIVGASGFNRGAVYAKWRVEAKADKWRLLDGVNSGQTTITELNTADGFGVWNEPLHFSYACSSLTGWPKLVFEIYQAIEDDTTDIVGYGWCHLPTTPGEHTREVPVFAPKGSGFVDDLVSSFLGVNSRYDDPSVIISPESRTGHNVSSMGLITINLNVVARMFPKNVLFSGGL